MKYRLVFDEEALRAILLVRGRSQRRKLLAALALLADNPFRAGDFVAADSTGRQVQIVVSGRYLVSYWPDHAVRHLRVLDIQVAE